MESPIIETARLRLRRHRVDDFDAYAAMWAGNEVVRFIGGKPFSREQVWTRLLRQLGMWQALGFGFWAVEDKVSGAFLGEAGFHDLKRDLKPSLEGTLEAGWAFVPAAHGRGIATEVVGAVVAWGDDAKRGTAMTCMIEPDNGASIRVAEKHGFRAFAATQYHGTPVTLYRRLP